MKFCWQLDRRPKICVKKFLQLKYLNVHDRYLHFILSDISNFPIINVLINLLRKLSSGKHEKILLRRQKFFQTKLLPDEYFYPMNIFIRRLLSNNRNFQEKVTKFPYFSPTILLDSLPISTVTKKVILKLILKSKHLQNSLLITQLKYSGISIKRTHYKAGTSIRRTV